ncbi:MAG: DsbE family thiol:disulfide interchange protein [Woeseiaceae bacterium]|jgi:cytochrome c biogenesis protein CcmG/thiol:disulfide interchange protein DsbE|nr:DsbE family thiol:disulfide interchange protein [Woeseiaceae bacterium]
MWKYSAPVVIFALLILMFVKGLDPERDVNALPSPFLGKPAPQFELPSLTDPSKTVSNANFGDGMALVNVWATWCVGCRQEHDFLLQLAESGSIQMFGLNWRDNQVEAQRWLQELGDPYVDTAYDEDGRAGINWGVYGAPETFLVGPDGTVLYKHLGPLNRPLWEKHFVPHLESAGKIQ